MLLRALSGFLLFTAAAVHAQTTQAVVRGRITDSQSGLGIANASVTLTLADPERVYTASTDAAGGFAFPLVTPGSYVIRASALNYQPAQLDGLTVAVAALAQIDLPLRPASDVWEQGEYRGALSVAGRGLAPFFGPDIDRSRVSLVRLARGASREGQEPTLSTVVTSDLLLHLPLAGRDAYSLLVLTPGVTADAGTARGLGVAVNGQRPSASNFLLDGVENQNYVLSAPQSALPPEAIAEYRLSTNNFSAEFGRSSGLLANVITRSGTSRWHGRAYTYFQNEVLNANGFQQNLRGEPRAPLRQWQPGATAGGPLIAQRTFLFAAFERLRTRTRLDPADFTLPSTSVFRFAPDSPVRPLLERFRAPFPDVGLDLTGRVTLAPTSSLDRSLATIRIDHRRLYARLLYSQIDRPDFAWSPYPDFTSALREPSISPMIGLSLNPRPPWTSEIRFAFHRSRLAWDRPFPEIPTLDAGELRLPGSPLFYAYNNVAKHAEVNTVQTWAGPRHVWKWGAGLIERRTGGALTAGRDGRYSFLGIGDFLAAFPVAVEAMVTRGSSSVDAPDYQRNFSLRDWQFFLQDAWRVSPRMLVSAGVRYETFGTPPTLAPDRNNAALRLGLSWQPSSRSPLIAKLGYGVFYDRPFDNQWRNLAANSLSLVTASVNQPRFPILNPIRQTLRNLPPSSLIPLAFPERLVYPASPRTAYVHSGFASLSMRTSASSELEVAALGALSRKLITSDKLARDSASSYTWRANQGASSYFGGSATWRYRSESLTLQTSYTWSHVIDNMSEALAGDFFDLSYLRDRSVPARTGVSAFTREGDSRLDRGSADFDQRHNLTAFALWQPRLARGWRFGFMAAPRSGFPYSVFALPSDQGEIFYNLRADRVGTTSAAIREPVPGGVRLLDANAFADPRPGRTGSTGRNAWTGPGFVNLDVSAERSFWRNRVRFRAESFNVLNHANLASPDNQLGSSTFGVALRGRRGNASSFPALLPFVETGRRFQILLSYEF